MGYVLKSCILFWLVQAFCGLLASSAQAEIPRFEATSCSGVPDISDVLPRLRCGVVQVPRDYAHPEGSTFALAVVVIASAQQPAKTDPVVYISGGPGAPLTKYAGFQARHPYAADRDMILIDQRGMGRSEPLLCPSMQSDLVKAMFAVVTQPTASALAADRAAHAACHDAIVSRGINPDDFGTAVTVEDFEWVRRALGVTRWNVIGESYGTTVAMTLLASHPQAIRSVVLDSLNPPDSYFGMPWSARVMKAREAFFSACQLNRNCSASYPNLSALYHEVLERLKQHEYVVTLPSSLGLSSDRIALTPSLFEELVGRLIYYPPTYADLPRLIRATGDGDIKLAGEALATLLKNAISNGNEGAFVAVECRDRPRWREEVNAGVSPLDLALLPPGICNNWSELGPEPKVPYDVTVPILALAGEFDPNITPEASRRVADRLGPNAQWILFAGIGHSVRHFSACAQTLVAKFIDSPGKSRATCKGHGASQAQQKAVEGTASYSQATACIEGKIACAVRRKLQCKDSGEAKAKTHSLIRR